MASRTNQLIEFAEWDVNHAARSTISQQGGFEPFRKLKPWNRGQLDHEGGIKLVPIQNDAIREAVRDQGWNDVFAQRAAALNSEIRGPQQLADPGGGIRMIQGPKQKWMS